MTSLPAQARDAYAHYRWHDAYHRFRAAREAGALDLDDHAAFADAAWWLGRNDESLTLYEQVYRRYVAADDVRRAARLAIDIGFLWLVRGEMSVGSGWISRAVRLLEDAPECAEHGYLLYLEAAEAVEQRRPEAAVELARKIQRLAHRHDEPTLFALGLVVEGMAVVKRGRVDEGLALLDEAMLTVRVGQVEPAWAGNLYCQLMALFIELADMRRARDWTDATERWCDRFNNPAMFVGICRVHRAQLLRLEGAWHDAEQQAAQACRDLADMNAAAVAEGSYTLGELHRLRGDADGAEEAYRRAHALGRDPQPGLGLLWLSEGRTEAADRALRTALAEADQPLARAPLLAAQVEVAAVTGDAPLARTAADELVGIADVYRTAGLIAAARQAAGTARLAAGEPERALPLLRDALRRWRDVDAGFETARVRCLLARALEAIGDIEAAGREVEAARAVFTELGATTALRDLSAPPRAMHPGGLSSREAEVLAWVAAGRTNRQIASELGISERTVERHLSHIFVKLDVSSRTEAAGYAFEHRLVHPSVRETTHGPPSSM